MKLRIILQLLSLFISISCFSKTTYKFEKDSEIFRDTEDSIIGISSDYSKYVLTNLKGKKQLYKEEYLEETIIYLGNIQVDGKLFHVLTSYKQIQAAIVKHGHSTLYLLDSKKRIVKGYELGLPEELPYKVVSNCLYFHYRDSKTNKQKRYINKIDKELPEQMCVEPGNCY